MGLADPSGGPSVPSLGLTYAPLKRFARTKVGRIVIPTVMVGGIVVAEAYLYFKYISLNLPLLTFIPFAR